MLHCTTRFRRLVAAAALGILALSGQYAAGSDGAGRGQQAQVQERVPPGHIRQAYAVGDLTGTSSQMADALTKLLTDTIAPESWSKQGGIGQIRFEATRRELIVMQRADRQAQVAQLLHSLRQLQREKPPQRMPRGPEQPSPGS
jgi:hypothetical protein